MSLLKRPPVRLFLSSLSLGVFAVGCSDSVGIRARSETQLRTQDLHFLQWHAPAAPRFFARGALSTNGTGLRPEGVLLGSALDELSLEHNSASFWSVRGEARSVQINYLSDGDVSQPFLRLSTTDPTYVPGQGELAVGDSVLITVTVDPGTLKVSLLPTGLRFGNASQLDVWYGGAGGDLNGDGVADENDALIEAQLGIWQRENPVDPWTRVPANQSVPSKLFSTGLQGFCDYAVSW